MARAKRLMLAGIEPLSPRRKWRAITLATLLLVPGYWSLVTGLVAEGSDKDSAPFAAPYIAFGLVLLPFVFLALAFLSEHPRAAGATARALVLTILVGAPVSAFARSEERRVGKECVVRWGGGALECREDVGLGTGA